MVLLLVFMQLTRDLFAIAKFLYFLNCYMHCLSMVLVLLCTAPLYQFLCYVALEVVVILRLRIIGEFIGTH